jgi:hypothetical protein
VVLLARVPQALVAHPAGAAHGPATGEAQVLLVGHRPRPEANSHAAITKNAAAIQ